jgi:hypothetical protein
VNQQQPDESPIQSQLAAPPAVNPGSERPAGQTKSGVATLAESRGMVLVILFGVTGALGIPLLWVNKRFSLAARIFWSIVVLFYTTALVGVTAAIVMWAFRVITGR